MNILDRLIPQSEIPGRIFWVPFEMTKVPQTIEILILLFWSRAMHWF